MITIIRVSIISVVKLLAVNRINSHEMRANVIWNYLNECPWLFEWKIANSANNSEFSLHLNWFICSGIVQIKWLNEFIAEHQINWMLYRKLYTFYELTMDIHLQGIGRPEIEISFHHISPIDMVTFSDHAVSNSFVILIKTCFKCIRFFEFMRICMSWYWKFI